MAKKISIEEYKKQSKAKRKGKKNLKHRNIINKRNIISYNKNTEIKTEKNSNKRLTLVDFLTPYCEVILAKGRLKATKLII